MSVPTKFPIKESTTELKKLVKKSTTFLAPLLKMLIEYKKHESKGISKCVLAEIIGVDPNSVQTWRTMYIKGGISA